MTKRRALTILTLAVVCLGATSALPARAVSTAIASAQGAAGRTYTPPPGAPERRAIMDAVRRRLNVTSQFEVHHLKVNGDWAYLRCGEVLFVEGERQETDLGVEALLQRRAGTQTWTAVEIWTLPTEYERPQTQFFARVRQRQRAARIPAGIFPPEVGIR